MQLLLSPKNDLSAISLENIEALANNDYSGDGRLCPDFNYAPNMVLVATPGTVTTNTDSDGTLSVAGHSSAGFKRNKVYVVLYETKNCVLATGSCCDQRLVGIKIVSSTEK